MSDLKCGSCDRWLALFLSLLLLVAMACLWPALAFSAQLTPGALDRQFDKRVEPRATDKIIVPKPSLQQPPKVAGEYRFTLNTLNVEGASVYAEAELAEYYQEFLGQDVSVKTLFTIAGRITKRYADDGYALSLAYVPAQEIDTAGRVHIVIVEGYISEVKYLGNVDILSKRAQRQIAHILDERPLTVATLERQLLLANDMPGISFITTIDRSAVDVGAASLVVEVTVQAYGYFLGLNNRGSQAQGPGRANFGLNVNNVFGADSAFDIQGQVAQDVDEMQFYALSYGLVLTDMGLRLNLHANTSQSEPDVSILQALEYGASSESYSVSLGYPLIRSRRQNLDIQLTLDVKESESQFFGATYSKEKTRVLRLASTYDWLDSTGGVNLIQTTLSQGMDILGATENDSRLKVREDADYHFTALRIDASRNQPLSQKFSLFINATMQYASDPLASSEQCGWGGELAGRAYDSFELSGDHGLMGGIELRQTWQFPFSRINYIQPYFYLEGAKMWTEVSREFGGGTENVDAFDYGVGFRGKARDKHYFYVELAKPGDRVVAQEKTRDIRFFAGWQMTY